MFAFCWLRQRPDIFRTPPSWSWKFSVVIEKLKEYANKGVPNIWLIDPRLQSICMYCPPSLVEIEGEVIATADGSVELSRDEIFAG
jgi:Uma2 family endonuclease